MVWNILSLALSLLTGLSYGILLLTSGSFDEYIQPLDSDEFMTPDLYGVGFRLLQLTNFDFKTRQALKTRESVIILYGARYADYYLRVLYAQKISLTYFCAVLFCGLSALAEVQDRPILLGVGAVLSACVWYYLTTQPETKVKERSVRFLLEFPNAVSTIALLVNSGMILREAWREVSFSEDAELYLEMRKVNEEMDNGVAEVDALYHFADRSATPEIKKFTSFIVQGLEKGSKDLADALRNQTDELWEVKRQNTIRQGELANSKLIAPLMVMFVGVIILVMGPILSNLSL